MSNEASLSSSPPPASSPVSQLQDQGIKSDLASQSSHSSVSNTRKAITPSRTLFVRFVPREIDDAEAEALFKQEPGYVELRKIRNIMFVEYDTVEHAQDAMQRLQHYRFRKTDKGILIDFDVKGDTRPKRKHHELSSDSQQDPSSSKRRSRERSPSPRSPVHHHHRERNGDRSDSDRDGSGSDRDDEDSDRKRRRKRSPEEDKRMKKESKHRPPRSMGGPYMGYPPGGSSRHSGMPPYGVPPAYPPYDHHHQAPYGYPYHSSSSSQPRTATLFIHNLPPDVTQRELAIMFRLGAPYCPLKDLRIIPKEKDHKIAFADFFDPMAAAHAMGVLNGFKMDKGLSGIVVEFDKRSSSAPSSSSHHHHSKR